MKAKTKARFLPSTNVQDLYMLFRHLNQGKMNVEEYTREFEKIMIKCDIHEPEEHTIVRYLGGLEPRIANVIELQAYTTFDEVCVLAHKVEQQRKSRMNVHDSFKPYSSAPNHEQTLNKGSSPYDPKPTESPPLPSPQKNQTPLQSLPPQLKPKHGTPRCFKCQGFGHIAADCVNWRSITLAEWEAIGKEEKEEETPEEDLEEIQITADEGELLLLEKTYPNYREEEHEQHANINVCMLFIPKEHPFPTKSFHSSPPRISYARILNLLNLLSQSKIQTHPPSIHSDTHLSFTWLT